MPACCLQVPSPCPGLGALLAAALDCPSPPDQPYQEAAWLLQHLSAEERRRLRAGVLVLAAAQRAQRIYLPPELERSILSLALS